MTEALRGMLARLPSIEELVQAGTAAGLVEAYGRPRVVEALRATVAEVRESLRSGRAADGDQAPQAVLRRAAERLGAAATPTLRPVVNLTGTVLHTNLGRALLPEEAIAEVAAVAREPAALEYDLARGGRDDRDVHVEGLLRDLTGAEAATVVNNNAAAVLLVLNALALRKDVLVSRGELIEIGGSFRVPEIMARAGCRLREVGTTNRTHMRDFAEAVTPRTALVMKVHPSNYRIEGFTAQVADADLAALARSRGLAYVVDLGSGSLVDLSAFGLPHEPTPGEAIRAGADLVTFSGDKLLGGPQAGLIVGRRDLIARIKRNPLRRALRCDKMTIAALASVLRLQADRDRLAERLPTLRLLTRPVEDIRAEALRLAPAFAAAFDGIAVVEVAECRSQIGSGALPADLLPSAALRIAPLGRGRDRVSPRRIAAALRALPVPVIGRIEAGAVLLDLRCLTDADALLRQACRLRGLLVERGGNRS